MFRKNLQTALRLFLFYVKIGAFTFGGGWSIIAQMQQEFVERRHMISDEELLDITSVGRSLPGTMIGNVAFLFGYHMAGFVGGIASLLGITFCPFVILSIVTMLYTYLLGNPVVNSAMAGIRAAVVPIMVSATLRLWKQAMKDYICYILGAVSLILCYLGTNNILVVLFGALAGLILYGILTGKKAKEAASHGNP